VGQHQNTPYDPEQLRRAADLLRQLFVDLARAIREMWERIREPLARLLESVRKTQGAQPLPADPYERALHLRRTRNIGPQAFPRPPQRIDPTRNR
jgi:hypothetical protein